MNFRFSFFVFSVLCLQQSYGHPLTSREILVETEIVEGLDKFDDYEETYLTQIDITVVIDEVVETTEETQVQAPTPKVKNSLRQNSCLHEGESLKSPNGQFSATMQSDGNFCVYQDGKKPAEWCTMRVRRSRSPYKLCVQKDANVCTYGNANAKLQGTWCTMSNGRSKRPINLKMQDDGNLVLSDDTGKILWSTKGGMVAIPDIQSPLENGRYMFPGDCMWSPNGKTRACMQSDGNFCIYQDKSAKWCSKSHNRGTAPRRLVVQGDNNLCIYGKNNKATWCTKSHGRSKGILTNMNLHDDGTLALHAGDPAKSIWTSKRGLAG